MPEIVPIGARRLKSLDEFAPPPARGRRVLAWRRRRGGFALWLAAAVAAGAAIGAVVPF